MIAEAATEKRPKRGRPSPLDALSPDLRDILALRAGSPRNQLNFWYALEAQSAIDKTCGVEGGDIPEPYAWLLHPKYRTSILSELGRFGDDETICEYARQICELKPTTKRGVAILRGIRTGKKNTATVRGIVEAVFNAIDEYANTRPGVTHDMTVEAMRRATSIIISEADSEITETDTT